MQRPSRKLVVQATSNKHGEEVRAYYYRPLPFLRERENRQQAPPHNNKSKTRLPPVVPVPYPGVPTLAYVKTKSHKKSEVCQLKFPNSRVYRWLLCDGEMSWSYVSDNKVAIIRFIIGIGIAEHKGCGHWKEHKVRHGNGGNTR